MKNADDQRLVVLNAINQQIPSDGQVSVIAENLLIGAKESSRTRLLGETVARIKNIGNELRRRLGMDGLAESAVAGR